MISALLRRRSNERHLNYTAAERNAVPRKPGSSQEKDQQGLGPCSGYEAGGEQPDGKGVGACDSGLHANKELRAIELPRRWAEQFAQVTGATEQRAWVELGKKPHPEQDQAEVDPAARQKQAVANRLQPFL